MDLQFEDHDVIDSDVDSDDLEIVYYKANRGFHHRVVSAGLTSVLMTLDPSHFAVRCSHDDTLIEGPRSSSFPI